jgi:hypothetical protein
MIEMEGRSQQQLLTKEQVLQNTETHAPTVSVSTAVITSNPTKM